ncbi:hypothetical protein ASG17_13255 [Brevundimonas sp. Leaf363]|uniref:sulfotransferase family protein n=1 Tax=Brevundimonas sp. Leaf363 TaxID=1736353 RepID=UPI0006F5DF9B|nr:sulfotransferase [Brevundimonas sp. Leaf363]KQS53918.1 hypothetical protein ASG17_13255 [Brevundimonas sp. Leaf363]
MIVLGMHRSGTSALTSTLAGLGYALPRDVMAGAPDNPRGFFEPRSVARLNERILQSLGGSWDQTGPFVVRRKTLADSARRIADHVEATFLHETCSVLARTFPRDRSIVIKDPRIALLTPLWRSALQALGYDPVLVHIHRPPIEVAASLQARNGFTISQGLRTWQTYVMSILRTAQTTPVHTLSFDQLLADPTQTLEGLTYGLGRTVEPTALQQAAALLAPEDRHQTAAALGGELPPIVADTARLLMRWNQTPPAVRQETIAGLQARFEDIALYSGPKVAMPARGLKAVPARTGIRRPPLLFHYHLFKNAGTSIDAMLQRNFGDHWGHAEFRMPRGQTTNLAAVTGHLLERPELEAFSSHTALLPAPALLDRDVLPILFLRHPIDRLRSAYDFEKHQKVETFGARLARSTDFKGYITALLSPGSGEQARNFQALRLADNAPYLSGDLAERAMAGLQALPFVGLVEAYDASLQRLSALVTPHYPGFKPLTLRKNASNAAPTPLDEKLAKVAEELGPALHERLLEANRVDLALHAHVQGLYGAEASTKDA